MRSLGEFFGHIARGVKQPVGPRVSGVRREVEERQLPGGVTVRRTTIEEVEVRPAAPGSNPH
ncbi:MAG: hypothetical protein IT437_11195 [Phycisphaerales bacterium]|nr:hypothetical protein [Phycisphaerales bacterium]